MRTVRQQPSLQMQPTHTTVVPAVPTATLQLKDIQGATQTGTPTFAGKTVQVKGEDKAITIKDNSYTLLDKDGNEVSTTPAYAADGTTVTVTPHRTQQLAK